MVETTLGIAEAKKRFSELVDRVARGERFLVSRRGKPAVALVSPSEAREGRGARPLGLAAAAGALAEWEELGALPDEIYAARRKSRDRAAPKLE